MMKASTAAARQIVVLHSKGDGILGPHSQEDERLWRKIVGRVSPLGLATWDVVSADDPMDEVLGYFRGAYDKKWWTFPSFLDNGFGPAIEKLYKDYLPLSYRENAVSQRGYPAKELRRRALQNWQRLEQDIIAEARALWQPCIDCLRKGERPPRYRLLAPLNHRASISEEVARNYILRLKKLAVNNWKTEQPPRPALGYVGFEEVGNDSSPNYDSFLADALSNEKLTEVNQSQWLFSHSGMRIPSQEVFEKSFKEAIMDRILEAKGGSFGRY